MLASTSRTFFFNEILTLNKFCDSKYEVMFTIIHGQELSPVLDNDLQTPPLLPP